MKSKQYVFTINNPTHTTQEFLDIGRRAGAVSGICQLEKGDAGTPHIQGFLRFANAKHFTAIKKLFPTAHVESAKSSFASWNYCSKEESRIEPPVHFGQLPKPEKKKNQSYDEFNK